jgi:GNAT superfamily N-acetyltransferase
MCLAGLPVIEPYLARPRSAEARAEIERIFFQSSGTKTFQSDEARAAFQERWLGRYFAHDGRHAFLAIANPGSPGETIAGYLVGSLDDPARAARFDDLAYFKSVADLTARYPAHLHVNLAEAWRGQGVGRALVEAFCAHARAAGAPGVHVFTGRGMRNVRFYAAAGFAEVGAVAWNGSEIVMLGRGLG